jgi:hypothetical protein
MAFSNMFLRLSQSQEVMGKSAMVGIKLSLVFS